MQSPLIRMTLVPVTAAAVAFSATGCQDGPTASSDASASASPPVSTSSSPPVSTSSRPSDDGSSTPPPSDEESAASPESSGNARTPAKAPCLAGSTALVGRLDGDPFPDKITDPDHTGTKTTVQWGSKNGSYGPPVSLNSLVGVNEGETGAVAVAGFRNKGSLDILVSVVEPAKADDTNSARIAEFRPGPVNRSNLRSARPIPSDIAKEGEVTRLQIANYNDDAFPDLAILHNAGDGQVNRSVRLSVPGGGLASSDAEANDTHGEWGTKPSPPSLPTDGWRHFYKPCS